MGVGELLTSLLHKWGKH